MEKDTGGAAFPKAGLDPWDRAKSVHYGMTLRDYFAAKVLPAVYSDYCASAENIGFDEGWKVGVAMDAYAMADAMLQARNA